MPVTFKNFEKRYKNLRKRYPDIENCSFEGCENPVDMLDLGFDTSCSYHRLLFDYWFYEVIQPDFSDMKWMNNKELRRARFNSWVMMTGKEECDKRVLMMAQDGINWEC